MHSTFIGKRDMASTTSLSSAHITGIQLLITMASSSGRQGTIPPEMKHLMEGGETTITKSTNDTSHIESNPSDDEGCRICLRDEDHANLLLCEACNDEYHTYCLKPALQSVPEDDWFCGRCTSLDP